MGLITLFYNVIFPPNIPITPIYDPLSKISFPEIEILLNWVVEATD